jgi:hypothetical protein
MAHQDLKTVFKITKVLLIFLISVIVLFSSSCESGPFA